MERRKRRKFTPEYKAEVVKLVQTSGKSIEQLSKELDLTETAVRAWVRQAAVDQNPTLTSLEGEKAHIRVQVRELARFGREGVVLLCRRGGRDAVEARRRSDLELAQQGLDVVAQLRRLPHDGLAALVLDDLHGVEERAHVPPGLAGADLGDALDEQRKHAQ